MTEVVEWLGFVSQYTAVYCDQQGLAAREIVFQYTMVYYDQGSMRQGNLCREAGHDTARHGRLGATTRRWGRHDTAPVRLGALLGVQAEQAVHLVHPANFWT